VRQNWRNVQHTLHRLRFDDRAGLNCFLRFSFVFGVFFLRHGGGLDGLVSLALSIE